MQSRNTNYKDDNLEINNNAVDFQYLYIYLYYI